MKISIPTISDKATQIEFELGKTYIFIGANGAGKTRLSVYILNQIDTVKQHILTAKSTIKSQTMKLEIWKSISDKEIQTRFDSYNLLEYPDDKGNSYSLYGITNLLLKQGRFDNFTNNTLFGSFPVQDLSLLVGGTISWSGCQDRTNVLFNGIDVEQLKFAEKFKSQGQVAIFNYRQSEIARIEEPLQNEQEKLNQLGDLHFEKAHRISAHRGLTFIDDAPSKNKDQAFVEFYNQNGKHEGNKPITGLQNDFSKLLSALTAEDAELASDYVQLKRDGGEVELPDSSMSKLVKFWNEILPHRPIEFKNLKLKVKINSDDDGYSPSDMSDGERNMLYILGQCLLAPENSLLIIDEPELHINKSIADKYWNYIKSKRTDCCLLFVTHDIDFILANPDAEKYSLTKYSHPNVWDISRVDDENLESIKIKILGSRKNILFVEGNESSLDLPIYKAIYPNFLVLPVESCNQVKSYVKSLNDNQAYNHLKCFGLIDKDSLTEPQRVTLRKKHIYTMNFAEIENMLLHPVTAELLVNLEYGAGAWDETEFLKKVFNYIQKPQNKKSYIFKRTKFEMEKKFQETLNKAKEVKCLELSNTPPLEISKRLTSELDQFIEDENITQILQVYRNKGLYKTVLAEMLNAKDIDKKVLGLLQKESNLTNKLRELSPRISET